MFDYYEKLGVSPEADAEAIKKAYDDITPKTLEVEEAYRELTNPEQRKNYDQVRKLREREDSWLIPDLVVEADKQFQEPLKLFKIRQQVSEELLGLSIKKIHTNIEGSEEQLKEIQLCFLLAAGLRVDSDVKDSFDARKEMEFFFNSNHDEYYSDESNPNYREYRAYVVQKKIYLNYQLNSSASNCRELAVACIQLSTLISTVAPLFLNDAQSYLLQAALFLKIAADLELDENEKLVDEASIAAIVVYILKIGLEVDDQLHLYTYLKSTALLSTLSEKSWPVFDVQFQEKLRNQHFSLPSMSIPSTIAPVDLMRKDAYKELYYCAAEYLEFFAENIRENKGVNVVESNLISQLLLFKICDKVSELSLILPVTDIQAHVRLIILNQIFCDHGFPWDEVEEKLDAEHNIINLDQNGWRIPLTPLPYSQSIKTYQSVNGFRIDRNTGKIEIVLTPSDVAPYKKSLSVLELQEAIRLGLTNVEYDLDVLKNFKDIYPRNIKKYAPIRQEKFSPSILEGTFYLSALRQADFILKQLELSEEIQHKYPYAQQPIDDLISALPDSEEPDTLKKVIKTYQTRKRTYVGEEKCVRFWLEACVMPVKKEEKNGVVEFTLKAPRMIVKTANFDAADNEIMTSEGWPIFVFPDEAVFRSALRRMPTGSSAIIIIESSNQVYFTENQSVTASLTIPSDKLEEFNQLRVEIMDLKPLQGNQIVETKNDLKLGTSDNGNSIYKFTKFVTAIVDYPDRFSNERFFAEELTTHFDELAEYFPEFERVRQLSALPNLVLLMAEQRKDNIDWIKSHSSIQTPEEQAEMTKRNQLEAAFVELGLSKEAEAPEPKVEPRLIPGNFVPYLTSNDVEINAPWSAASGGVKINSMVAINNTDRRHAPPTESAFSAASTARGAVASNLSDVMGESIHRGSEPQGFGSTKPSHLMRQQGVFSGPAATAMSRGAGGESIAIGASSPFAVSSDNDPISAMLGPRTQAQNFVSAALNSEPILAAPSSFAVAAERARVNEPTSYVDFSSLAQKTSMSFESMALKSDNIFDAPDFPLFSRPAHPAQRIKMEKFETKLGRHSSQFFNKKNGQYTSIEKMLLESARSNIYRGTSEVTLFKGGDPGDGMYYKGKYDPAGKKFMFEGGASFSRSIVLDVGHVDLTDFSSFDYYIEAARVDAIFNGKMEVSAKGITAEIHAEAGVKLLTATGVATARGNFMGITFNVTATGEAGLGYTAAAAAGVDLDAIRQKASIYYKIGARLGVGVGQTTRIEIGKDEIYIALLKENNQKQLQSDPDFKYIDDKMNNQQIPSASEMEYYETQVNSILIETQRQRGFVDSVDSAHPQEEVAAPQRTL